MRNDINKLERLAERWLKDAAKPEIAARREMNQSSTSMKDVQALIEAATGKNIMDALRQEWTDFINIEQGLLIQRQNNSLAQTATNEISIIVGTLLAICLGVVAMLYTTKKLLNQVGGEPTEIADITQRLAAGDLDILLTGAGKPTGIYAAVQEMIKVFK